MARQATMTPEELQWVRAIHWDNEHTKLISAALGDPRACVGFDPTATLTGKKHAPKVGCWLFARMCKVTIAGRGHGLNDGTEVHAPIVWWPWRDEETMHPLSIHDPRVMQKWNASDTHKLGGSQITAQREKIAEEQEREEAKKSDNLALMLRDDFKVFKRWGDEVSGFSGREGPGGQRKLFFRDSLRAY